MRRDGLSQEARRQAKEGGRAGPFAGAGHRGGGAEGAERGENDARTRNRTWK